VSRFPRSASVFWIAFPTSVDPGERDLVYVGVRHELGTGAAVARDDIHHAGELAWRTTSQNRRAVSGVVSAGFSTTVLPAASAGAISTPA